MKITAISGRGSKKDFIDLYFITQDTLGLTSLMTLFTDKYKHTGYSTYHLIRSLGYFEDADKEKDPIMLQPLDWEKIKGYFLQQQKQLLKQSIKVGK